MNWIGKWWTNDMWLAQSAHFLLGLSAMTLPFLLWGKMYGESGTILLVIYGIVKEAVLDPWIEGESFVKYGWIDLLFLLGGSSFAWMLYIWR